MEILPVDAYQSAIVESLKLNPSLVLTADTGTGKSTRIPQFLMRAFSKKILLLEPRRIAARSVAARIAKEYSTVLGGSEVGYQIRFDNRAQKETKLKVITEGILLQILQSNPFLDDIECIVLDEFHERNLYTDLALATCREIQKNFNPQLKIIVMSATMDALKIAEYLNAPTLEIVGKRFPVEVTYAPEPDKRSQVKLLEQKVFEKLKFVLNQNNCDGDILIFLPGLAEINRCLEMCSPLERTYDCAFYKLHSSVSQSEQDLIFEKTKKRKIIFSTNIAETSLTIPGVRIVIDSGLEKVSYFDSELRLSRLELSRISMFSAKQRAGRAGRVGPGWNYRLWSELEEESFELEASPSIHQSDLSLVLLQLLNWRGHFDQWVWYEAPSALHLQRSWRFLEDLSLVKDKKLLPLAHKVLDIPLSLRARLLLSQEFKKEARHELFSFLMDFERIASDQLKPIFEQYFKFSDSGRSFAHAMLLAFSDRLGVVQANGRLLLLDGAALDCPKDFALKPNALVLAYEIQSIRKAKHWERRLQAFLKIERSDVEHVFGKEVTLRRSSFWDEDRKKVRCIEALSFRDLNLEAGREVPVDPEAKKQAFSKYIHQNLVSFRASMNLVDEFLKRVEFLELCLGSEKVADFSSQSFLEHTEFFVVELNSISDLSESLLLKILKSFLSPGQLKVLEQEAPESLQIEGRTRAMKLRYDGGDRVVLSARLKDMYGIGALPKIGGGKVSILAELLAPNFRPVQVTKDLEGFWSRSYPEIKKELKARYPKHFKDLP